MRVDEISAARRRLLAGILVLCIVDVPQDREAEAIYSTANARIQELTRELRNRGLTNASVTSIVSEVAEVRQKGGGEEEEGRSQLTRNSLDDFTKNRVAYLSIGLFVFSGVNSLSFQSFSVKLILSINCLDEYATDRVM